MAVSPSSPAAFELLVLDPGGRIRFGNAQASEWLAQGDAVCRRRGGLAAANVPSRDALDRLLRATLADAAGKAPAVPRVVPLRRRGRLPLIAVALPITGDPRFELGAVVLLRDPEVLDLPPAAMLCEAFGLTRAEASVALGLFAGQALKDIAAARRTSVNTVRTLLGRVFAKTGCRRQSELVRLVGALNDARAAGAGLAAGLSAAGLRLEEARRLQSFDRLRALLRLPLHAPPDQHATIVSRGFAPGDDTGYHVHGCGHEIVCVLQGSLTMEYPGQTPVATGPGEAIYVAPGVVHRGANASESQPLSLFHIGIGPGGSIDRRNL